MPKTAGKKKRTPDYVVKARRKLLMLSAPDLLDEAMRLAVVNANGSTPRTRKTLEITVQELRERMRTGRK
jgi:hypothetical protein